MSGIWTLLLLVLTLLVGCGGSEKATTTTTTTTTAEQPSVIHITATPGTQLPASSVKINGIAQLGLISGAKIKLFKLPEMTLLAESNSSTSTNNYGSFSFSDVSVNNDDLYLLESVGGVDTDPNDDGLVLDSDMINVKGSFKAIVQGKELKTDKVRINVLTDYIYQYMRGTSIKALGVETYVKELNLLSEVLAADINNDGITNYEDVLNFDPLVDANKINFNYDELLNFYVPAIHENLDDKEFLKRILYLSKYQIDVSVNEFQIAPFDFKASLSKLPSDITVKWQVNGNEHDFSKNYNVTKGGTISLKANLYYKNEKISEIEKTIYAATVQTITSGESSQSESVNLDISSEFGDGASVYIPSGASSQNIIVEVKKLTTGLVPVEGSPVSDTIILYPAGATFSKPITVAISYFGEYDPESFMVARYSENGNLDYLTPTQIDVENSLVYFEINHFSTFVVHHNCLFLECKSFRSRFSKIKDLLQSHYVGEEDWGKWTDEKWEEILNTSVNGIAGGSTVYDYFINLNNIMTTVQVIDEGKYEFDGDTKFVDENARYLSTYEFLYPDDETIRNAQKKWNDIKEGLERIQLISSVAGVAANTKSLVISVFAMTGLPTDLDPATVMSTLFGDYIYNPVQLGDILVGSANRIALNTQIKKYFFARDSSTFDPTSKISFDEFILNTVNEYNEGSGWLGNSYSGVGKGVESSDFFKNVDNLYLYYNRYKTIHEDSSYINTCGSIYDPYCEDNLYYITPEAGFSSLVMKVHKEQLKQEEKKYIEENPTHYIKDYKIDSGNTKLSGKNSYVNISINTNKREGTKIQFTLKAEGSENHLKSFSPKFSIYKKCDPFDFSCNKNDLSGLTYNSSTINENSSGEIVTEVNFTAPNVEGNFEYEFKFEYNDSLIKTYLNDGHRLTLFVTQPPVQNLPPQIIELRTISGDKTFASGDYVSISIDAFDPDGSINDYQWSIPKWTIEKSYYNNRSKISFTAPEVSEPTNIGVFVRVTDNKGATKGKAIVLEVIPKMAGKVDYESNHWILKTKFIFKNQQDSIISVPTDAYVRFVPRSFADNGNHEGIICKVQSDSSLGSCSVYSDIINNIDLALSNASETYQVAVFKEYKKLGETQWNCGEDTYKLISRLASLSDIIVSPDDYQSRGGEDCSSDD
ncbi:MAG: hypothetical protein HRT51_01980 [Colwellia sp.]|nr:hypothetical protein [Colwellia sp.]